MGELLIITALATLAALALAFLLPKPASVAGNRLKDLSVTDSAFGNNIPYGLGHFKVSADLIYAQDIRETSHSSGGKGGPEVTEYNYFLNAIYGALEGPITRLTRIWFDKHLYYDVTGTSVITEHEGLTMRHTLGTLDQTPDTMQTADKGADLSPAYKGLVTVAVENLDITDFGRRPPTMEVEVNGATGNVPDRVAFILPWGDNLDQTFPAEPAEDWSTTGATDFTGDGIGNTKANHYYGMIAYFAKQLRDRGGGQTEITIIFAKRKWYTGFPVSTEHNPTWDNGTFDDNDQVIYIRFAADDITLTSYGSIQKPGLNASPTEATMWEPLEMALAHVNGGYVYDEIIMLAQDWRDDDIDAGGSLVWLTDAQMKAAYASYATDLKAAGCRLHFWDIGSLGNYYVPGGSPGTFYWDVWDYVNEYIESMGEASLETFSGVREWWIGLQYENDIGTSDYTMTNTTDDTSGHTQDMIDALTYSPTLGIEPIVEFMIDGWFSFYGGQGAINVDIADIVRLLLTRVGYVEGVDFDVSAVTGTALGFVVDSQESVADLLEDVLAYYFLIVVEEDGMLVFKPRSTSPIDTVSVDEFIVDSEDDDKYVITVRDDSELPYETDIRYINYDEDYEANNAHWQRPKNPDEVVYHYEVLGLSAPLVLTPSEAKQIALKWCYLPWAERESIQFKVPWTKILWNAGDIITITFEDASTRTARIDKADFGANFIVEVSATLEDPEALLSFNNVDASGGSGSYNDNIPNPPTTEILVLDLPYLREVDVIDTASLGYLMVGPNSDGTVADWRGATPYRSDDQVTYESGEAMISRFIRGIISGTMPDPIDLWRTDTVNSLVVDLEYGATQLASITRTGLLNGGNGAVIFKTNGDFEIIQYQDVAVTGANQVTLTNILRGRRGTDTMAYDHTAGETILFLDPFRMQLLETDFSKLNADRFYRAVSFGRLFESATDITKAMTGRELLPYAPVLQTIVKNTPGAGDLTISWSQRQRYGTAVVNGQWKHPEEEASVAFEVDILDSPGGTVVRTLTSTTQSVVYPSAQRVADGFNPIPATLDIVVYKMSEIAGRGYGQEVSVEIQ